MIQSDDVQVMLDEKMIHDEILNLEMKLQRHDHDIMNVIHLDNTLYQIEKKYGI